MKGEKYKYTYLILTFNISQPHFLLTYETKILDFYRNKGSFARIKFRLPMCRQTMLTANIFKYF